jgi:hypothetical protein
MSSRVLVSAVWFVLLTLVSGMAFGQKNGASVVILKFERFNVPDDVMSTFYKELNRVVDENDDMDVKRGGEITVQDLALTAGCDAPTVDCLSGLRDIVDADQIIFGSVQRSDDVFLFTIRNFDFGEGNFVRDVADQTIQGTNDEIKAAIPAIVENFLYGAVGITQGLQVGRDIFEWREDGICSDNAGEPPSWRARGHGSGRRRHGKESNGDSSTQCLRDRGLCFRRCHS